MQTVPRTDVGGPQEWAWTLDRLLSIPLVARYGERGEFPASSLVIRFLDLLHARTTRRSGISKNTTLPELREEMENFLEVLRKDPVFKLFNKPESFSEIEAAIPHVLAYVFSDVNLPIAEFASFTVVAEVKWRTATPLNRGGFTRLY